MPTLKKQAFGLTIGLSIQYILGIATNLFVQFPESVSESQIWEFAKSQGLVLAHMIVGILLFVNAAFLVYRSSKQKQATWKLSSGVGILSIIGAGFAGSTFVSTQDDRYSFLMAFCFITAMLSYIWGIYTDKS